jgi:hypothetical protein
MLLSSAALAQEQPPGGPGGPGGGPPDFAQMRQQMMDRLKDQMGATDDEWKALQPLIEKVQQLQRQTGGRGGPGMFGPGGPGGPRGQGGPPQGGPGGGPDAQGGPPPGGPGGPPNFGPGGPGGPPSEVQQKQSDLRDTLQNKDAAADEVNAKLAALREARAKAKADLAKAQEDLKQVLGVRQEAVLVAFGIIE